MNQTFLQIVIKNYAINRWEISWQNPGLNFLPNLTIGKLESGAAPPSFPGDIITVIVADEF